VYTRDTRNKDFNTYLVLAILTGCVGLFTGYQSFQKFGKYRDVSASLNSLIVHPTGYDYSFNPALSGDVVHVNIPQNDMIFERSVHDPYFNLNVPGAVSLRRNVQYCQWQEHVHERTHKTGEHTERVERTYTYTKTWRPYLVNSLFFDQPAAHHNPQRQPVSSGFVDSVGISSTKGFKIGASHMKYLKCPNSIITFRQESLKDFVSSPAVANDKFFYTGNDGWFLSKYDPSTMEKAMKMAFQYAEGTLFDFQLGDLFSVCDAGDVRVQMEGQVINNGVSVIALQNSDGTLTPFKSLSGRNIMLVQQGQATAEEMIEKELSDRFWKLVWYIVGFAVSGGLCGLFIYLLKKEHDKKASSNHSGKTD